MTNEFSQWRRNCETGKGGPKQPYDDSECGHTYEADEDALELVCADCGDRQPMDLSDVLK